MMKGRLKLEGRKRRDNSGGGGGVNGKNDVGYEKEKSGREGEV